MGIRAATAEDAPAIRRVARAAWHAAYDPIVGEATVEEVVDEWYDVDALVGSIDRRATFVATENGEVVGFCQGAASDDGPTDAVVSRLYVHPDRWGEGNGTALLDRLFDTLRAAGHGSVHLSVLADNDVGRSFYRSHGFEVHEERTVDLAGTSVDDVVLVRDL